MSTLTLDPLISPAAWMALAASAAVLLAWYARSRPASIAPAGWAAALALTACGAAGVLVILLNPIWLETIPPPAGKPVLTILLDQSASMAVPDGANGRSRFAAAAATAGEIARNSAARYDVQLHTFGDRLFPATADELPSRKPDRQSTDLAAVVGSALAVDHPQGHALVLLSDGIHNAAGGIAAVRDAIQTARATNVPIFTSTYGSDAPVNDVEVAVTRPQELAFAGQSVPVSAVIRQRGALTDRIEASLWKGEQRIDRQSVPLPVNGTASVHFNIREDHRGLFPYEVRIDTSEREATAGNNTSSMVLRVVDSPIRVLLLEGKPYWDGKFLIRTLAADPSLELDAVIRITDSRFLKRSLRLPEGARDAQRGIEPGGVAAREDQPSAARIETSEILTEPISFLESPAGLVSYQVVVLGRDAEAFLNDRIVERLRHWMSHDGGSLVCYRGAPVSRVDQQLGRLLPVRWTQSRETRFRLHLTDRGRETDWLTAAGTGDDGNFDHLPTLATLSASDQPKPFSVVYATAEQDAGPAVVSYQSYGTGRAIAIEGAGMWRWAFLAPQYQAHDQVYAALWQSLLRWLISSLGLLPGEDLALRTDKVRYTIGEPVAALLLTRAERSREQVPRVELVRSGQSSGELFSPVPLGDEPGVFRVPFGELPEGHYEARVVEPGKAEDSESVRVAFDVRPYFGEQLDVQARPDLMARIAVETEGAVLTDDPAGTVNRAFEKHLTRSQPERLRRLTAWDKWWVFVAITACWGTAWVVRRSAGLI
jgi:hypothetical protein